MQEPGERERTPTLIYMAKVQMMVVGMTVDNGFRPTARGLPVHLSNLTKMHIVEIAMTRQGCRSQCIICFHSIFHANIGAAGERHGVHICLLYTSDAADE